MTNDAASRTPAGVRAALDASGVDYEVMDCDPELADTAVFCERYGFAMEDSANAILVKSKTGEEKFVACVVLANTRLDVNKTVRKKLVARKVSFADPQETRHVTGMELGGVTPPGLPAGLPIWVDARVMARPFINPRRRHAIRQDQIEPGLFPDLAAGRSGRGAGAGRRLGAV